MCIFLHLEMGNVKKGSLNLIRKLIEFPRGVETVGSIARRI